MKLRPLINKHNYKGMWICNCLEGWIIPNKYLFCKKCGCQQPNTKTRWKEGDVLEYSPDEIKITTDMFYTYLK